MSDAGDATRLKRAISGPLLFLFILGDVLGAGVYALVGKIAGQVGGASWAPLAVALVFALLTAASYAELVTKYPRAGGPAVFAERAFRSPFIAFLVGFSMLSAGVTSAAGLALAFAGDYLRPFLDVAPLPAAILGAALIAFYSFVGFETSANIAEEVRDVRRVYPRALFGALLAAGIVYVLVAAAATVVLDPATLGASSAPLLDVVRATGYPIPEMLFAAVALVAVANGALLTQIMASRLAFGMAEERLLPATLGRVLPHRRTPWVAIVATTLIAMGLAATGTLTALAETVVLLLLVVFVSTNVAVLVLRRTPVAHDHFRAPTWMPVLAIASCVLLFAQQSAGTWLRAALMLAAGALFYLIIGARKRASAVREHANAARQRGSRPV